MLVRVGRFTFNTDKVNYYYWPDNVREVDGAGAPGGQRQNAIKFRTYPHLWGGKD